MNSNNNNGNNLILVNEKEKQFQILELMKLKGSFNQLERAENEIKLNQCYWFVDDIINPSFIISFELLDALIKVYIDNNSIEQVKKSINSINWNIGFFKNFNIDENELLNKNKIHNNAIKYHLQDKIEKITIIETCNLEIVKYFKKVLTKSGYKVFTSKPYNEYVLKCNSDEEVKEKIKIFELNLDGNEVLLTYDDIEFVNSYWKYKSQFSTDEFKWSIDNKLSFGYKINGKLVSWNLVKSDAKTVHLYTLDEFRGKGYALKVKSIVLSTILKNNLIPLSYIYEDNIASHSLSTKLGFKQTVSVQSIDAIIKS